MIAVRPSTAAAEAAREHGSTFDPTPLRCTERAKRTLVRSRHEISGFFAWNGGRARRRDGGMRACAICQRVCSVWPSRSPGHFVL